MARGPDSILFSVLPPKLVHVLSARYPGVGAYLAGALPALREDMLQAEVEIPVRDYAGNAFFASLGNAATLALVIAIAGTLAKANYIIPLLAVPAFIFIATFFTLVVYPKIIAKKRARALEIYVIPAARQLLIQLRSGVPLFNAMASLASDYGDLSVEFKKIVNRINSGVSDIDALTEAARANPSLPFRRMLWQMANALKVGGEVGTALDSLLDELSRDKMDSLKRYGQELSPWVVMYMLMAIIVPSIGISMIIVILSLLSVDMPKVVLGLILLFLAGFNIFFLDFAASRRPSV